MRALVAVQRCCSCRGTVAAEAELGAGAAAGRLIVARVELCHQNIAITNATVVAIAAAAMRSPRVRRSGAIKA